MALWHIGPSLRIIAFIYEHAIFRKQVSGKDDKNTFRVELDLGDSGLAYLPGDALGIYPTNSSKVREGGRGAEQPWPLILVGECGLTLSQDLNPF